MSIIGLVQLAFSIFRWILIFRIFLSWVTVSGYNPIVRFLYEATEPVLRPIRRLLPTYSGIDFSPIIVFLLLGFVERLVLTSLFNLLYR